MAEIFTAVCAGLLLHIFSAAAGFILCRAQAAKRRSAKKCVRAGGQTPLELERIRQAQEEYRSIAQYDGTAQ